MGRVHRDVARRIDQLPKALRPQADSLLQRVQRILTQKTKDKDKLCACILQRWSASQKVSQKTRLSFSVATTRKEGVVVELRSMPGNPWGGHTLEETLEQVGILNDRLPKVVILDKGYQGVGVPNTQILRSAQRGGDKNAAKDDQKALSH